MRRRTYLVPHLLFVPSLTTPIRVSLSHSLRSQLKTNLYRTNLSEYPAWAQGLNDAAQETEVPIQFCMAMPSDIMLSVELDWVTNARASDDYAGGSDNLLSMPHAALLMWSLGIRPSKDNFWTSNVTDNPYQKNSNTPKNPGSNVELNTIVAVLSTGPVGISDKVGATNATLIMATCDANGRLLQPSKPLTPSERMYTTIGAAGSSAELWSTYSSVGDTTQWLTVGTRIATSLPLSAADLFPAPAPGGLPLIHRYWHSHCEDGADAIATGCIEAGVPDMRSTSRSSGTDDFAFDLIVSQVQAPDSEWVLLGELSKYTTVSSQRFTSVATGTRLVLTLAGMVGETVAVTALHKVATVGHELAALDGVGGSSFKVVVKVATMGPDGSAALTF